MHVNLISCSVPCQPASVAGRRKGTGDPRWLWPDALRLVSELKPDVCVFENPTGLLSLESGLAFEHICSELEAQGYTVQPFVLPALAVDAPHRRDRIWIIASNTDRFGRKRGQQEPLVWQPRIQTQSERGTSYWANGWDVSKPRTISLHDGVSGEMVRLPNGRAISGSSWQKQAIKAYGNSVVVPVVTEVLRAVKQAYNRG